MTTPSKTGTEWSIEDDQTLIIGFAYSMSISLLANKLKRSQSAIISELCKLDLMRNENGNLYTVEFYGIITGQQVTQCNSNIHLRNLLKDKDGKEKWYNA